MDIKATASDSNQLSRARKKPISISRCINERYPPLHELLCAHDVARLTRRPRWVIAGLCLIGRFPRKLLFRGRAIGWRRSDLLPWLARDLVGTGDHGGAKRSDARRRPRQISLPFKRIGGVPLARGSRARPPGTNCNPTPRIRR